MKTTKNATDRATRAAFVEGYGSVFDLMGKDFKKLAHNNENVSSNLSGYWLNVGSYLTRALRKHGQSSSEQN